MKNNKTKEKQNKGITLISLVITIIVMLILAGISIAMLTGENGILSKAAKAREETQIKAYEDKIRLAITEENMKQEQKSEKEKLEGIKEILQKDQDFKKATITGPDENGEKLKLTVVTKEGYTYYVYTDDYEYKNKEKEPEETPIPELTTANTIYTANPSGWTNGKVTLTASTEIEGYTIQTTTKDPTIETNWEDKTSQEFTENGTMYTRLWNGTKGGTYSSGKVTNIDKEYPIKNTELATSNVTENGFTISVDVTDSDSGLGKIIWYHKKSNEDTYISSEEIYTDLNGNTEGTTSAVTKTKTYDDLTSGETYNIYAEVYDVAGNKVRIPKEGTIEETVKKIEGQVTLSANSGTYTSGADTFTITNNISGGTLTVTSSNTNIATATISGNIVTITPGTTEGTATITVTSAATGTYNEATAEYTAIVGHHFASKTTTADYLASAADCTHEETYYYKCTRCTEKGTETYTNGSSLGHDESYVALLYPSRTDYYKFTITANVSPACFYFYLSGTADVRVDERTQTLPAGLQKWWVAQGEHDVEAVGSTPDVFIVIYTTYRYTCSRCGNERIGYAYNPGTT